MLMKRYRMPAIGTLLPPAENEYTQPSATNQDDVLRFQQAAAQQEALDKNTIAEQDYRGKFASWFVFVYDTGRAIGPTGLAGDPHAVPPQPPKGYMAVVVQNEAAIGFECQQVGPPVCEVPPYKRIPPPQH